MNAYTHMVVGGLTGGVFVAASLATGSMGFEVSTHTIYPFITVIPAVYGALGPDVDLPQSKAGKRMRQVLTVSIVVAGIALLVATFTGLLSDMGGGAQIFPLVVLFLACALFTVIKLAKHRGVTHTGLLWLCLIAPLVFYVLTGEPSTLTNVILSVYVGFLIGWFSHLVADSFNKKGVPWLFPLSSKKINFMTVTTGTHQETVFRFASIIVFVAIYVFIIAFGR